MTKDLLLSDELSTESSFPSTLQLPPVGRRGFVKTALLVTAGATLLPKSVLAEPVEAGVWRDRVTGFVSRVFDRNYSRAQAINNLISQSRVEYAPRATTFHSFYSAPLIFVTVINGETVICERGFEVRRYPFYGLSLPVQSFTDLNAYEIRRITNEREIARLGCVVAPNGYRTSVDDNYHHADYRATLSTYRLNPAQFRPLNKRVYTGTNGRSRYGYQIEHKTDVGPSGKPLRDILLSDRDW